MNLFKAIGHSAENCCLNSLFSKKISVYLTALLLLTLFTVSVSAATAGPNNAGTGTNVTGIGIIAWSNPGNITAADTISATAFLAGKATSNYLAGTNYGFNIPAGATINGIRVSIMRQSSQANSLQDNAVQLIKGGAIVNTNKATSADWPTDMEVADYGSTSDLWGTTWTSAQINASNFGVALSAKNTKNPDYTAFVDYIQVTVTYTPDITAPSGGSITYTSGYYITTSVPITYTLGTDSESGLNLASGKIQRASATLSGGTCGTFGSFTDLVIESDGSHTDTSVASGNCYKYQYLISDNAGNTATYTSASVAKIDTDAPTTTDSAGSYAYGTWTNSNVIVTLTPADSTSGVASTKYCTDTINTCNPASGTAYTAPVTISTEGTTYFRYSSTDNAGNVQTTVSRTVKIDKTAPTYSWNSPTADIFYKDGDAISVDVSITETGSGIANGANCNPKIDNATTSFTGSVTYSTSTGKCTGTLTLKTPSTLAGGAHPIAVQVADAAGNSAQSAARQIRIDNLAPTTSDNSNSAWRNSDATVTPFPSDGSGSGIAATYYCVDTAGTCTPATTYSAPVSVSCASGSVCRQYVRYYSTDNVGNVEATKTSNVVRIDKETPTVSGTTLSGFTTAGAFIKGTGTIVGGTASDASGSGIDNTSCQYTANNGANWYAGTWNTDHCEKTGYAISDTASYTFNTRISDNAGNQGTGAATATYTGDTTAPSIGAISITPMHTDGGTNYVSGTSNISASITENGSGVASCEYTLDGGSNWTAAAYAAGTCSATGVDTSGATSINMRATDNIGNVGSGTVVPVTPDTTNPTITVSASPNPTNGITTITVIGNENIKNVTVTITLPDLTTVPVSMSGSGTTWTGSFTPAQSGTHAMQADATDMVGNPGSDSDSFYADFLPPESSRILSGTTGLNGWYTSSVNVSLSAEDKPTGSPVGLNKIEYKLSGATVQGWTDYTTTFTVSNDGTTVVEYRAIDNLGNTETVHSVSLNIDQTNPGIPSLADLGEWSKTGIFTVSWSVGSDAPSGTAYYKVYRNTTGSVSESDYYASTSDPSNWINESGLTDTTEYYYKVATVDVSGRQGALSNEESIRIDLTAPSSGELASLPVWRKVANVDLSWTAATDNWAINRYEVWRALSSNNEAFLANAALNLSYNDAPLADATTYYYKINSFDQASWNALSNERFTTTDLTAPVTNFSIISGTVGSNGWYTSDPTFELSASDATSGVNKIEYHTGGAYGLYTGAVTLSNEGTTIVFYKATDNATNTESEKSNAVKIDKTNPYNQSIVLDSGAPYNNTGTVTATLSFGSDDISGIDYCEISWNGGSTWTGIGKSTSESHGYADGSQEAQYRCYDKAGRVSATQGDTIFVDTVQPHSEHTLTPASPDGSNGWYVSNVTVNIEATDSAPSLIVKEVSYIVDGGSTTTVAGSIASTVLSSDSATHTVEYYAKDNAGNTESPTHNTGTIKIDQTKPTSNVAALPVYTASLSFTVNWSGSDATSGIATYDVFYSEDGGAYVLWKDNTTDTPATFAGTDGKKYKFYSRATDVAGNEEDAPLEADAFTTIDVTPPVNVLDRPFNQEEIVSPFEFLGTTTDATSGVESVKIGIVPTTGGITWYDVYGFSSGDKTANWYRTIVMPDNVSTSIFITVKDVAGNTATKIFIGGEYTEFIEFRVNPDPTIGVVSALYKKSPFAETMHIFGKAPLSATRVALKVWSEDGAIVWSQANLTLTGRDYEKDIDLTGWAYKTYYVEATFYNCDQGDTCIKINNAYDEFDAYLVKDLQGQLASLSSQVSTLTTTVGILQTDLDALEGRVTINESDIDALEVRMAQAESDIAAINGQIALLHSTDADLQLQIDGLKTRVGDLETRMTSLEGRVTALEAWKATMETWKASVNTWIGNTETTLANLALADADLHGQITVINGTLDDLQSQINSNDADITAINHTLGDIATELAGLHSTDEALQDQIDTINTTLLDLQGQINDLASRITTLEGRADTLEANVATLQTDMDNAEARILQNETDIGIIYSEIATLQGRMDTTESDILALQGEVADLHSTDADLQLQIDGLKTRVGDLETRMTSLEGRVTALETWRASMELWKADMDAWADGVDTTLASLAAEDSSLQGQIDVINTTLGDLQDQITSNDTDIATINHTLSDIAIEIMAMHVADIGLQSQINMITTVQIPALQAQLNALNALVGRMNHGTINLSHNTDTQRLRVWGEVPEGTATVKIRVLDTGNNTLYTYTATLDTADNTYEKLIDASGWAQIKYNIRARFVDGRGALISEAGALFDDIYIIWIDGRVAEIENTELPAINAQITALWDANALQSAQINALKQKVQDLNLELTAMINDLNADTYARDAALQAQVDALKARATALEDRMTSLEGRVTALEAWKAAMETWKAGVNTWIANTDITLANLAAKDANLQAQIGVINTTLASLQAQITSNDADIAAINATLGVIASQISALQAKDANLQAQINNIVAVQIPDLQSQLNALKDLVARMNHGTINLYYSNSSGTLKVWGEAPEGTGYAVIKVFDIWDIPQPVPATSIVPNSANEYEHILDVSAWASAKYNVIVEFHKAGGEFIGKAGAFLDKDFDYGFRDIDSPGHVSTYYVQETTIPVTYTVATREGGLHDVYAKVNGADQKINSSQTLDAHKGNTITGWLTLSKPGDYNVFLWTSDPISGAKYQSYAFVIRYEDFVAQLPASSITVVGPTANSSGIYWTKDDFELTTFLQGINWTKFCDLKWSFQGDSRLWYDVPYELEHDENGGVCEGTIFLENLNNSKQGVYRLRVLNWFAQQQKYADILIGIDHKKPKVGIWQPGENDVLHGPMNTIRVLVSEDSNAIKEVWATIYGKASSTILWKKQASFNSTTGYYEALLNSHDLPDGAYDLDANAMDVAGNTDGIRIDPLIDNTAPVIKSWSASSLNIVRGEKIAFTAMVSDNLSGTSEVTATITEKAPSARKYSVKLNLVAGTPLDGGYTGIIDSNNEFAEGEYSVQINATDNGTNNTIATGDLNIRYGFEQGTIIVAPETAAASCNAYSDANKYYACTLSETPGKVQGVLVLLQDMAITMSLNVDGNREIIVFPESHLIVSPQKAKVTSANWNASSQELRIEANGSGSQEIAVFVNGNGQPNTIIVDGVTISSWGYDAATQVVKFTMNFGSIHGFFMSWYVQPKPTVPGGSSGGGGGGGGSSQYCGDNKCTGKENYCSCQKDCSAPKCGECEQAVCDNNVASCTAAKTCNGNGKCEEGENCENAPQDCKCREKTEECIEGQCFVVPYCGDSFCSDKEDCSICPKDCGCLKNETCTGGKCIAKPYCGDSICQANESLESCPKDCKAPITTPTGTPAMPGQTGFFGLGLLGDIVGGILIVPIIAGGALYLRARGK